MEQVLDGLERTSSHLAKTLNLPPVDVEGLRKEWSALQGELRSIPPKKMPAADRLEQVWRELQESAKAQGKSVFVVSSAMAVSTVAHVPADLLWLSRAAALA